MWSWLGLKSKTVLFTEIRIAANRQWRREIISAGGPMMIVFGEIAFRVMDKIHFASSTCRMTAVLIPVVMSLRGSVQSSNPAQALVLGGVQFH